jgi:hypothetical protein
MIKRVTTDAGLSLRTRFSDGGRSHGRWPPFRRRHPAHDRLSPTRPMPSRTPSRPTSAFHPPTDAATFRDLVLFEERLKSNAALLKRRKRRYQRS